MFSLVIVLGLETTDCGFHIVKIGLVILTRGLISFVNDNHVDNNQTKSLVFVYFGHKHGRVPQNL